MENAMANDAAGLVAGSASPVGLDGTKVIADDSVGMGSNFVVGANKEDYHLRNANYRRDFSSNSDRTMPCSNG